MTKQKINLDAGRYWDRPNRAVTGCSWADRDAPKSCGCCWAAKLTKARPVLHAGAGVPYSEVTEHPEILDLLLKTKRPTVFLSHFGEFYHPAVSNEFRAACFGVFLATPQHTYLLSTHRWPEMAAIMELASTWIAPGGLTPWPPPNVYILLSAGTQGEVDEAVEQGMIARIYAPGLRLVLNLEPWVEPTAPRLGFLGTIPMIFQTRYDLLCSAISGVILGAQTGKGAAPMHPDVARSVRDQCAEAGVDFFLKSLGPGKGRTLDGSDRNELPWLRSAGQEKVTAKI